MSYATEQERFWAGDFGAAYIGRNQAEDLLPTRLAMMSRMTAKIAKPASFLEFGPNVGGNLLALRALFPQARIAAVEINPAAVGALSAWDWLEVREGSLLDGAAEPTAEFAFTSGVLIHVAPERLGDAYDRLYAASSRYVALAEYYNPTPVEVPYRGHDGRLFKRDFAGELMDRFPDLALVDYGFMWRRDPVYPADDATWFVLEKR